jgi:thioredoxin reductase (NADPH)
MAGDAGGRLDCLVIGGGPAGLTAALYLARFERRFLLVDSGASRASWIPSSHNFPVFSEGVSGTDMLARQRAHLAQYGVVPEAGTVTDLQQDGDGFRAVITDGAGGSRDLSAEKLLLATGALDIAPDMPDLADALRRGLVRYCPICDGYEARGQKVAVIGHGDHGLGEAAFLARTYAHDVTLLTLGRALALSDEAQRIVAVHGIKVIEAPVEALEAEGDRIAAIRAGGAAHRFDTLYSALGLAVRSGLAVALGAAHDGHGALVVDGHQQTTVPGLYAAGDNVVGLNQIVVAMGQAAVAATAIHNACGMDGRPDG